MKTFDIVIVNWNSSSQLKECVDSVGSATKTNCVLGKIIVVDNASNDNSLELLDRNISSLEIIENSENLGFGKACNQGASYSKSDFILFLNPDMLVFEDTFSKLFAYIDKHDVSDVGIFGIQLLGENKNIQRSCARFPSIWNFVVKSLGLNKLNRSLFNSYHLDNWDHSDTKYVDHLIGAFYMIKSKLFDAVGGFDERFFVYMEDLDLSKRVNDRGFKSLYITESQAYHKGGGTSENVKNKRLFYSTRSRIIYAFKHFGLLAGLFLLLFIFIFEPITRSFFLFLKGDYQDIVENLKGFLLLYKDTFNIIKLGM